MSGRRGRFGPIDPSDMLVRFLGLLAQAAPTLPAQILVPDWPEPLFLCVREAS